MPPTALALIDAVFGLALHHDRRARAASPPSGPRSVEAAVRGPTQGEPFPGSFVVEIVVDPAAACESEPAERISFFIDPERERLLAAELSLAELPLDRGGLARLIGELEAWCYERVPEEAEG